MKLRKGQRMLWCDTLVEVTDFVKQDRWQVGVRVVESKAFAKGTGMIVIKDFLREPITVDDDPFLK